MSIASVKGIITVHEAKGDPVTPVTLLRRALLRDGEISGWRYLIVNGALRMVLSEVFDSAGVSIAEIVITSR